MKHLAVIVLNYKVKPLTLKCIESVKKSSFKNFEIFVVDNNSEDNIKEAVEGREGVTFLQSGANLGYAGGNNVGIKKALEEGFEKILILNPDTTVQNQAIKILVEKMDEYQADLVCPKIYFAGSKTLWFAGKRFDINNVLGLHRGVDEEDLGQYDQDEQIGEITGAAVMIKRKVFEKVGLFDERYFMYYEDSDFAKRAIKSGFKIMYIPKAVVYHANAQASKLGSPLQDYFITRNRMLYAFKYLSWRTRFALLREAFRNLAIPARRLALYDFLIGNLGKGSLIR